MPKIESWPLESSFGERLLDAHEKHGQLCVGLDPSAMQLSKWGLPYSAAAAEQFCSEVLDNCQDLVGVVKPQVSFFEQFGSGGFASLERVLVRAKEMGLIVIADAKRGDIGSTMDGYARAWLSSDGPFMADAVTCSPYLGVESLGETIEFAARNSRGVFILSATSNAEATALQSAVGANQESVSGSITSFTSGFNTAPLGSVGVVIGARTEFNKMGIDVTELSNTPILAPGFGTQGANLSDARSLFGTLSDVVLFNVSRSIAGESAQGVSDRVKRAKAELEIGLSK